MRARARLRAKRRRRKRKNLTFFLKKVGGFLTFKKKPRESKKKVEILSKDLSRGLLNEAKRKFFIKAFFLLSLVLLIQIVFEILFLPFLCIRFIEFKGASQLGADDLLSLAGIQGKEYYFSLEERSIAKRLTSFSWFKKAEVKKVFPNRLKINIEEREPVFLYLSKVDDRSGSVPVLLDEEGIAFASGQESLLYDLPILSGVAVQGLGLKCQFPCFLSKLFEDMAALKREHRLVYDLISEVCVKSKWAGESYELSLYLRNTPIVFQLASRLNIEKLTQILLLLDLLDKNKEANRVAYVDLRASEAVYCYKGE